ncbi:MAG: hypothetical protein ABI184_08465 [Ginsengibacter sp.]
MKEIKLFISAFICCVIFSCHSNDKEKVTSEEIPDSTVSAGIASDSAKTITNQAMIWTVDDENPKKEQLKKPVNAIPDSFSTAHVIQLINDNFSGIQMELIKVSNDTVYVKIPDDTRLTQKIGNTGAENYFASATFTLTELKNIKYVNFALEPGDHAEPGVFSREDFKRLR